jgi:thioesterase domain-containing protein
MATHYIREMKSVQPTGPYRVLGHCMGGVVAYEMAQQLRAAGDEVELLGLLGSISPTYNPAYQAKRRANLRGRGNTGTARAKPGLAALTYRRIRWRVRRLFRSQIGMTALRTFRLPVPASFRKDFFLGTNALAEQHYRPAGYPGRATLFFPEGLDDRSDLGWKDLVADLDIRVVNGEHSFARDLTMEPSVAQLSELLADALRSLDDERSTV